MSLIIVVPEMNDPLKRELLASFKEAAARFIEKKELPANEFIPDLDSKSEGFRHHWAVAWASLMKDGLIKHKDGDKYSYVVHDMPRMAELAVIDIDELMARSEARESPEDSQTNFIVSAIEDRNDELESQMEDLRSRLENHLMRIGLIDRGELSTYTIKYDGPVDDSDRIFIENRLGLELIDVVSKKGPSSLCKLRRMPLERAVELKFADSAVVIYPEDDSKGRLRRPFIKIFSQEETLQRRAMEKRETELREKLKKIEEQTEEVYWLNQIRVYAQSRTQVTMGEVLRDVIQREPDEHGRLQQRVYKIIKQIGMKPEVHRLEGEPSKKFTVYKWPQPEVLKSQPVSSPKPPEPVKEPEPKSYEEQLPNLVAQFDEDQRLSGLVESQRADIEYVWKLKVDKACAEIGTSYDGMIDAFKKHGVNPEDYALQDLTILAAKDPNSFKELVLFALRDPQKPPEEPPKVEVVVEVVAVEVSGGTLFTTEPKPEAQEPEETEPDPKDAWRPEGMPEDLRYDYGQIEEACLRLSLGGKFPRKYLFPEDGDVDWQRNVLRYLQYNGLIQVEGEKFHTKYQAIPGKSDDLLNPEILLDIAQSYSRHSDIQNKFRIEPAKQLVMKPPTVTQIGVHAMKVQETSIVKAEPDTLAKPEDTEIVQDIRDMFEILKWHATRIEKLEEEIRILKGQK